MSMPPQAAISDLVPLMYRAHPAWFGLSGEVRACESGGGRYRGEVTGQDGEREVLDCDGTGDAEVNGRPALHVTASGDALPAYQCPLSGAPVLADQVEAFIDRELGICLRQACSYQGHPVLRTEFTGLTTNVDQNLFSFQPPPGLTVITGGPLAEAGLSPATIAVQAAKGATALALEIGRRWLSRNKPVGPGP